MFSLADIIWKAYKYLSPSLFISILTSSDNFDKSIIQPARRYAFTATNASLTPSTNGNLKHIPDYVLEYAPYCYLYSEEEYWPGPLSEHLEHTIPYIRYDPVPKGYQQPNLHNLDQLNQFHHLYLTSNDDPESYPDWLGGLDHIPDPRTHRSSAPAVLLVVDKHEYVDAFWFFFYSFNLGNQVLGYRFGNHVGDWEHTAIRFQKSNGKPIEVFYSEHAWGAAYRWEDVEKHPDNEKRMLTYSAYGTHAMYRTAGPQPYVLPFGLLLDITDKGHLWDPTLNTYVYTYEPHTGTVQANASDIPEQWFHFRGKWGDKAYPNDDPRQYEFFGELHYESGPTGPKFKNLGRSTICQNSETECIIRDPIDDLVPREVSHSEWEHSKSKRIK